MDEWGKTIVVAGRVEMGWNGKRRERYDTKGKRKKERAESMKRQENAKSE